MIASLAFAEQFRCTLAVPYIFVNISQVLKRLRRAAVGKFK